MIPKKPSQKTYTSYLIRCWLLPSTESGRPASFRFVVETISGSPRRWGFNNFEELVTFLQAEFIDGDGTSQGL
jgi:hypothetical protein